jgi:hypothetical protein
VHLPRRQRQGMEEAVQEEGVQEQLLPVQRHVRRTPPGAGARGCSVHLPCCQRQGVEEAVQEEDVQEVLPMQRLVPRLPPSTSAQVHLPRRQRQGVEEAVQEEGVQELLRVRRPLLAEPPYVRWRSTLGRVCHLPG